MQTKAKSNSIVTHKLVGDSIEFTVKGFSPVVFDPTKAAQGNRLQAERHGWIQRIVDSAAIGRTDKEGVIIPEAERTQAKFDGILEMIQHYESGGESWNRSGARGVDFGLILAGVMRATSLTSEQAERRIEAIRLKNKLATREDCLKYLSGGASVKQAMLEIQAAKIRPVTDADKDLESLGEETTEESA